MWSCNLTVFFSCSTGVLEGVWGGYDFLYVRSYHQPIVTISLLPFLFGSLFVKWPHPGLPEVHWTEVVRAEMPHLDPDLRMNFQLSLLRPVLCVCHTWPLSSFFELYDFINKMFLPRKNDKSWPWWLMPIISALKRLRQEDQCEFEVNLGCTVCSSSPRAIE